MRIDCGIVERDDGGATFGGRGGRRELVLVVAGGAHAEHVPVQRAARREAEIDHQVDLGVGEAVEATRDDELELRARAGTEDGRELDELLA